MKQASNIIKFSDEEFQKIYQKILLQTIKNKQTTEKPIAHILGGQSGAGKSRLNNMFEDEYTIVINGDNYRKRHPRSDELDRVFGKDSLSYKGEFSGKIVETLIDELSKDGKYNLVIEGTLRTAEVPLKTAMLLKERGYDVSLDIMATKPEVSYLSTILRYEKALKYTPEIARYIPLETHNKILEAIPDNLEYIAEANIFDEINMWDRGLNKLYSSLEANHSIYGSFNKKVYGEWTDNDIDEFIKIKNSLEEVTGFNISNLKGIYDIPDKILYLDNKTQDIDIEQEI